MADKDKPERIQIKKAVALRYKPPEDVAPTVAAKGRGNIAEKIIALAEEYGVPIKEDPDLVEVLAQLEVEEEIPPEVYVAVAEILSFIYRTNQAWRERFQGLTES